MLYSSTAVVVFLLFCSFLDCCLLFVVVGSTAVLAASVWCRVCFVLPAMASMLAAVYMRGSCWWASVCECAVSVVVYYDSWRLSQAVVVVFVVYDAYHVMMRGLLAGRTVMLLHRYYICCMMTDY